MVAPLGGGGGRGGVRADGGRERANEFVANEFVAHDSVVARVFDNVVVIVGEQDM
jgi:hypothetical protein